MPMILKNHYALYPKLFTTPSVDQFVTFYEAIIFNSLNKFKTMLAFIAGFV